MNFRGTRLVVTGEKGENRTSRPAGPWGREPILGKRNGCPIGKLGTPRGSIMKTRSKKFSFPSK